MTTVIYLILAVSAVIAALTIVGITVWLLVKPKSKKVLLDDDGTVNSNYAALLDDALQGNWENENGRWQACFNGLKLTISLDGEVLFNKPYTIRFSSQGNKTYISIGTKWLRRDSASALRVKEFYRNGDKLFITTIDPDKRRNAFDDMQETVIFAKKQ